MAFEITCEKCGKHLGWGDSGDFNMLDFRCDNCKDDE